MTENYPKYIELLDLEKIVISHENERFTYKQGKLLMAQNAAIHTLGILIEQEELSLGQGAYPLSAQILMAGKDGANYIQNLKLYRNQEDIILFQYLDVR